MSWLKRLTNLFSADEEQVPIQSGIRFGRYSDNNKTANQTKLWYEAENLYKEKKINESLDCFFRYLRDEKEDNVIKHISDGDVVYHIHQGTKIIYCTIAEDSISAYVTLVKMQKPVTPVMRRLLELNYSLYYSRYALHNDTLCMLFDTHKEVAGPNKMYYALKEMATKADKQDDLLTSDFSSLEAIDTSHVVPFDEQEKEVKYRYFCLWIEETIKRIDALNQDSFSGGIAYLLLNLIYKIDYLITPEGKLLNELEDIHSTYWNNKEEKPPVERNKLLVERFKALLGWPKEEVLRYFYRAKFTFSVTAPKAYQLTADSIRAAKENMFWYRDNHYIDIAREVLEYGSAYAQFSYSMPSPYTQLFHVYMQVNYTSFFKDLGIKVPYKENDTIVLYEIKKQIEAIIHAAKEKYPLLTFNTAKINPTDLLTFNHSFLQELELLNFDAK